MRVLVLAACLLLFAGCPAGSLPGGRYTCTFDGGLADSQQCPGDFRCGLEGYCHHYNDTSQAWRCLTSAQCELDWLCGLDDGKDGGVCRDPGDPQAWVCSADGQCATGWRCGQDQHCQNQSVAAPYACGGTDGGVDDSWCEKGWRCAPEGVCIDPSRDALLATSLPGFAPPALINGPLDGGPIGHFSVSQIFEQAPAAGLQTTAFAQGQTLSAIVGDRLGSGVGTYYRLGPWDDAVTLVALGSRGENFISDAFPDVTDQLSRVFVADTDGGVRLFTMLPDAGSTLVNVDLSWRDQFGDLVDAIPVSHLTVGTASGNLSPRVIAYNDDNFSFDVLIGTGSFFPDALIEASDPQLQFTDEPGNRLVDLTSVRPDQYMDCVFAVDNRGLWVSQLVYHPFDIYPPFGSGMEEIDLPPYFTNPSCLNSLETPVSQKITGLAPWGKDWLGVSSTLKDGTNESVSVLDLRALWTRNLPNKEACQRVAPFDCNALAPDIPISLNFGPCLACPGGKLLDFSTVVDPSGKPHVEVRCGGADGGTTGFFTLSPRAGSATCDRAIVDKEDGPFNRPALLKPDNRAAGLVTCGSSEGLIWSGRTASEAASVLFDRPATTVARRGPLTSDVRFFTPDLVGAPLAGQAGFTTSLVSGVVSGVSNEPDLVVTQNRQLVSLEGSTFVGDARVVGLLGSSVTPFTPPYNATSVHAGTMAKALVVTAGSSIFSAEVGATQNALLGLRAVAPGEIDSIAFPAAAPATDYLQGYLVTFSRVFRVTAATSSRWSFTEIPFPVDLIPVEVWFEAERGRVGFADGQVYSLPSRVPLSPAVPKGIAIDYAQTCGQQFVLASTGLFRLEPVAGKTVGDWKPVPLPEGFVGEGLGRGRLHAIGTDLYVFKQAGETARVTLASCPVP